MWKMAIKTKILWKIFSIVSPTKIIEEDAYPITALPVLVLMYGCACKAQTTR